MNGGATTAATEPVELAAPKHRLDRRESQVLPYPAHGLALVFGLLDVSALHGHEETLPDYLAALTDEIGRDGELRQPIVVDRHTLVILDGHHRTAAIRNLGCSLIPVYLVDYGDPAISVEPRRPDIPVSKESVVRTGLSGKPYPPKTSRHVLPGSLPARPTPLELLRRP